MINKVASLEKVSKIYGRDNLIVKALDKVSLDIFQGDYLAVMGASGSGKSTAMNILGCLDRPSDGLSRHPIMFIAVLLPDPLAPITAK